MDWFYETPLWLALPLFVIFFVLVSWAILLLLRPWVQRASSANPREWDRVLGYAISSYGVFYGITLALIAVSVYGNYRRVDAVVLNEASVLGSLYRDVSGFPSDVATELRDALRSYTRHVVEVDWPRQREGVIPIEGDADVMKIEGILFRYQPATASAQALFSQTIGTFNEFVRARRDRLNETVLALPALLWWLLAVGAVINAVLLALIEARDLRIHLAMSGLIALFVALLIFVTASIDHPYSGYISVKTTSFETLLKGSMKEQ